MKSLIYSEWERLLSKKIFLTVIYVVPFFVVALASYYSNQNAALDPTNPEYVYISNFPVLSLAEIFIPFFNALAILLTVFSFTDEFRSGQIRFILLRRYTAVQIFISKLMVVILYQFCVFIIFYVSSFIIGHFYFSETNSLYVFHQINPISNLESYIYGIKYYALAFLALISITAVFIFISSISSSNTIALSANLGFIVFSMFMRGVLMNLFEMNQLPQFFSLISIQFTGITQALANIHALVWITLVQADYIFLFLLLTTIHFSRKDFYL
ncbi:hypothetical protein HOO54_04030 [Bacillus sp. WMMC1349]|uniref:hypothetical protein n=1 Tax=Bacillus sp. WMMC1349 TaxID=2736254 RepID=UPI001557023F|nr:hypothetical protein [Bacillus sp. WMMC1349]NPC91433.1 hypothetical protein [Bacillus sp. WMMC1349]